MAALCQCHAHATENNIQRFSLPEIARNNNNLQYIYFQLLPLFLFGFARRLLFPNQHYLFLFKQIFDLMARLCFESTYYPTKDTNYYISSDNFIVQIREESCLNLRIERIRYPIKIELTQNTYKVLCNKPKVSKQKFRSFAASFNIFRETLAILQKFN